MAIENGSTTIGFHRL